MVTLTWKLIYGWVFFTCKPIHASALTSKIGVGTLTRKRGHKCEYFDKEIQKSEYLDKETHKYGYFDKKIHT